MVRRLNIDWILSIGRFQNQDINLIHDVIKSFVKGLVLKQEKCLVALRSTTGRFWFQCLKLFIDCEIGSG